MKKIKIGQPIPSRPQPNQQPPSDTNKHQGKP